MSMEVRADMVNGHKICHGGFIFLLADSTFAFACNSYNRNTVAAQAEIDFLAPAKLGDTLVATSVERHRKGRSGLYDSEVVNQDGTVIAHFRGRCREIGGVLVEGLTEDAT
jgi:acyl-CoA thioesterase